MEVKRGDCRINRQDIAEYWSDKAIRPDGRIVKLKDFSELLEGWRMVLNLNTSVPHCWACGKPFENTFQKSNSIFEAYRDIGDLNRCHIKARQFGGEDSVENLFLMCEHCHQESPDTLNRTAFFRWVYDRKSEYKDGLRIYGLMNDVKTELARRGYDFESINSMFSDLFHDDDIEFIREEIKSFWDKNAGTHGRTVVKSTVAVVTTDILLKLIVDRLLEV